MRYSTLLMDLDNTILSFDQAEEYALRQLFDFQQLPWNEELFRIYQGKNKELWEGLEQGRYERERVLSERFVYIFDYCGKKVNGYEMDELFRHHLAEEVFFMPNALDTLDILKENRVHLHMVTNGVAETQKKRVKKAELSHYFKQVFISEEVGFQKPAREFFRHTFANIEEKDLSKIMIVGDSLSADIKGGNQSGIDTCWYFDGEQEMKGIQPTYHIKNLNGLLRIM